MPTYEYKCNACEDRFEKFQPITDDPLDTCEKCGGKVKRLIGGGGGVIFKGSGFYVNDYKKEAAPACGGCSGQQAGTCPASSGGD